DNAEDRINRKVNVNILSKEITEVLDVLFHKSGLGYRILGKQVVIYAAEEITSVTELTRFASTSRQQPAKKQITGKVIGPEGEPISGANIIEAGTNNGT